jgi:hypothetical protein
MKGTPIDIIRSDICKQKKDALRNAAYKAVV